MIIICSPNWIIFIETIKYGLKTLNINDDLNCVSVLNYGDINKTIVIAKYDQLKCPLKDWVDIIDNGIYLHKRDIINKLNLEIKEWTYSNIRWKTTDYNYLIKNEIKVEDGFMINKNESFFIVKCESRNNQSYKSAFVKIFTRPTETRSKNPFNVLFIDFDSVSRIGFFQDLPMSSDFLKNQLKSNILWRYNIVGDGTPAALIPI